MRRPLSRGAALALLFVWSALTWWLLTSRSVPTGARFPGSAWLFNLAHAVLFGVEALLLGLSVRPGPVREAKGAWLGASLLALLYSGLLEWRQAHLTERHASWLDMLTNGVGAFGFPWALATERPTPGRVLVVAAAAAAAAAWATLSRG